MSKNRKNTSKRSRKPAQSGADLDAGPDAARVLEQLMSQPDELRARAAKLAGDPDLAEQIMNLSPEEAAMFVILVERRMRHRRLQIIGYIAALIGFIGGMLVSFALYANREPGEFVGWVFLIPFTVVAGVMLLFGYLSRRA